MKIATGKYFQYLFWFGPMLIAAGITASAISGNWGGLSLGLLILGLLIIAAWLVWTSSKPGGWGSKRSAQVGVNAAIATLAVVAILILVNFLAVRYGQRIDLTETQLFTLSPQTQQVVKSLQQPVKVWIFERDSNPSDRQILENYRRYNPNFSFEFVDPQVQLGLTQKFKVQSPQEVHIEAGDKRQLVQSLQNEAISEGKLTNAIEQVTSDRQDKIYFLQGHREHSLGQLKGGMSQAISALKEKNYLAEPLDLAQKSAVPKDAKVVVVAGPQQSLFPEEVKALSGYLAQGGSLLLLLDPNTNTGLDSLLQDWGIKLDNRLVVDASGTGRIVGLGPATPMITRYGEHPITKDFTGGFSFYPMARALEITPVPGVKSANLLITDDQSWAESDIQSKTLNFDPSSDRQGPLTLGAAFTRLLDAKTSSPAATPDPNQKLNEARLVAIGDSDFATDGLFDKQLNGDVLLNSVGWLSKRDSLVLSIRPKEQKNRRINLTAEQGRNLSLIALVFMPLLAFAMAGLMWWQRR